MAQAVPTAAPAGLVLGRYRPLRPLGSGGSGSVWLARDERAGVEVALKIVAREGKAAQRAEREARTAARLRHPHCLRAYALAHDAEHVYIAYEYVPGRTLRDALRQGGVTDAIAVEAAAQTLDGLAHAHAAGIVHRDVKPSNVLLADGDELSVRLLDFGLARAEADAETLTAVGDVPGTLAYIAPERLAGEPATPASDVWSVGVLLWEALAGGHPFWKPSLLESAAAIKSGAPSLATVRPDLPRPLVTAVDRALSRQPARRPSAAKLASLLRDAHVKRERSRPQVRVPDAVGTRALPATLAALVAGWGASALPFYPASWRVALAAAIAAATLAAPRAGTVAALGVPIFPLGNLSLGLALLYVALAAAWLLLVRRGLSRSLAFIAGPLLAPVSALGLLPLVLHRLSSPVLRAASAALAVPAAAVVAGLRDAPLPFTGAPPPAVDVARAEDPLEVASALWSAFASHPPLLLEALVLAAAAAALPLVASRGAWWIAGFGAAFLATALLPFEAVAPLPLVVAAWITCAAFWLRPTDAPRH